MRMFLICYKCASQNDFNESLTAVELEENGLYRMTCARGHKNVMSLQQMKFEVLFEVGVHAIIDGYYIEAVSAFTSAFERFLEFYVELQCFRQGISESTYVAAWKQVSNQSERQLGAFIFTYLAETHESPVLLTNAAIKFRNGVIHKGIFPTRKEAFEYGEQVLNAIAPILARVRSDADAEVQKLVFRHIQRVREGIPNTEGGYMCLGTILSLSRATTEKQYSLQEWIEMLEQRGRGYPR